MTNMYPRNIWESRLEETAGWILFIFNLFLEFEHINCKDSLLKESIGSLEILSDGSLTYWPMTQYGDAQYWATLNICFELFQCDNTCFMTWE